MLVRMTMMKPLSPDSSKALLVSEKCAFPWRECYWAKAVNIFCGEYLLYFTTRECVCVCVCVHNFVFHTSSLYEYLICHLMEKKVVMGVK